ncbi:MAG: methyl-accepting chemotaxis protein [Proteobacteria bacterium]|nr:methyl-accepting chemotaxis protein [Pseudomonadota bacterium]
MNKNISKSLRLKFQVPTLSIVFFLMIILGSAMTINSYLSAKESVHHNAEEMINYLSKISATFYANYDYQSLENFINEIKKSDEVDYAVYYNDQDNPITKMPDNEKSYLVLKSEIKSESGIKLGYLKIGFNDNTLKRSLKKSVITILISISISFILFSVLMRTLVDKLVIKPIKNISEISANMAMGDLTNTVNLDSEDEVGMMASSINSLGDYLKNIIIKINKLADDVFQVTKSLSSSAKSSEKLSQDLYKAIEVNVSNIEEINKAIRILSDSSEFLKNSANNASSSSYEMSASINNIAESADVLSKNTYNTASSIEEMASSVKEIESSLEVISNASEATSASIIEMSTSIKEVEKSTLESADLSEKVRNLILQKGITSFDNAIKGFENIKKNVEALSVIIGTLGEKSSQIGRIVGLISDIADNTNLLALNASILAAQSQEQGKGFSVVAEEIKNLSKRTSASTKEIEDMIETVQSDIEKSVSMTKNSLESIEEGVNLMSIVRSTLLEILENANISAEKSKTIQKATTEQALGITNITKSVNDIKNQIDHIFTATQELSKSTSFIVSSIEKLKDLAMGLKVSTDQQSSSSKQISEVIENVYKKAEEITTAIIMQNEKSRSINESLNSLKNIGSTMIETVEIMKKSIDTLGEGTNSLTKELQNFKI